MSSSQINFFILPEDLPSFEGTFLKRGALFIRQPIYDLNNMFTPSLQFSKNDKQWDKIYLTTKEFLKKVVIEKVKNQPYHLVNEQSSEVVEFSRGGFLYNENELERARLYFVTFYFENNLSITKSSEFNRWAKRIISSVKNDLLTKRKSGSINYLSNSVENWMCANNASIDESGLHIIKPSE